MGEWIGRGEYSWKTGKNDWQISGEAAFNNLDSVTRIFLLEPDGEFDEIDFPRGTGKVSEERYELLGTWGRPLSSKLTLQVVAGGEYSTLSSSSNGSELVRSFFRPKGSVSLAWKPSPDLDVSLKLRRRDRPAQFLRFPRLGEFHRRPRECRQPQPRPAAKLGSRPRGEQEARRLGDRPACGCSAG